jgi:hypothetical protein
MEATLVAHGDVCFPQALSSAGTKCGDDAVVVGPVNRTAESNEKTLFVKITLDRQQQTSIATSCVYDHVFSFGVRR